MGKKEIKAQVKLAIINSQLDVEDVVILLEIETEELLRAFPDKLVEHAEKFGVYEEEDSSEG